MPVSEVRRGRTVGTYISELGIEGLLTSKKFMDFCMLATSIRLGWLGLGGVYDSDGSEKGL